MQQLHAFAQAYSTPLIILTLAFLVFVLFSKINNIFKVPAVLCVTFVMLSVFYPETLEKYLGANMQTVALICFVFSVLAFLFSTFRFLKASINIFCWLTIATIAGAIAFPDYAKVDFNKISSYLQQERLAKAVNSATESFRSSSVER